MIPKMKPLTDFLVWNLVFNVFSITSPSVTNSNDRCEHPWKSDFGLSINSTDVTEKSLSGLRNIINGFLSNPVKDGRMMMLHLHKCSKSVDCRLSTILDKKKMNVMSLCIKVDSSDICYQFNCTCQKKQRKRAIDSEFAQNKTEDTEKIGDLNNAPHCEFHQLKEVYSHGETVTRFCQNVTCTTVDLKNGLEDEKITAKEECLHNSRIDKDIISDTNTGNIALCFTGGILVGLFLGVFITRAYFKRISKQPKVLSVRNMVYNQGRTTDEEFHFTEITEYSEIPDNYNNIKVMDGKRQEKSRKIPCEHDNKRIEICKNIKMHTPECMIAPEDSCGPCFEDISYPRQSIKDLKRYLEPITYQYHKLSQDDSKSDVIEKDVDEDVLTKKEENTTANGRAVANQVGLQNEKDNQYKILEVSSKENREIFSPKEEKIDTSDLFKFKDECSEKESEYFVLSKVEINQPWYYNILSNVHDTA